MSLDRPAEAPGPSQSAERQLWCAVIGRALEDAIGNVGGVTGASARHRAMTEARSWFACNDGDFRQVCEAAGYDPDLLRSRALRLIGAAAPPVAIQEKDNAQLRDLHRLPGGRLARPGDPALGARTGREELSGDESR